MEKKKNSLWEILKVSTKLGLTSFGGPIAHLGFFKKEYIDHRKWIDEKTYADLIALCQFLPGPASSQLGIAIGTIRGGLFGGFIAWLGFTVPSAIALALFALVYQNFDLSGAGWIHGLKVVAVAIVAHAILGMGKKLTPDRPRITIAIIAASIALIWPTAWTQVLIILTAGIVGIVMYGDSQTSQIHDMAIGLRRRVGVIAWVIFFGLLTLLPFLRQIIPTKEMSIFDTFYRAGSLVFGGGHVVLPLLEREVVPVGLVSTEAFLAGYGAAQAVPGPLFTFASYLGAIIRGPLGAVIALTAIFLPSFLLIIGALPFLNEFRKHPKSQSALTGINAAVVGILIAALYNPVWVSSIRNTQSFIAALILFGLIEFWKVSPIAIVVLGALAGLII